MQILKNKLFNSGGICITYTHCAPSSENLYEYAFLASHPLRPLAWFDTVLDNFAQCECDTIRQVLCCSAQTRACCPNCFPVIICDMHSEHNIILSTYKSQFLACSTPAKSWNTQFDQRKHAFNRHIPTGREIKYRRCVVLRSRWTPCFLRLPLTITITIINASFVLTTASIFFCSRVCSNLCISLCSSLSSRREGHTKLRSSEAYKPCSSQALRTL